MSSPLPSRKCLKVKNRSLGALIYYLVSGAYANPKTLYDAFRKFIEYERKDETNTIATYITQHSSNLSVRYVTSETFMNDFINSLRDKRIEGFKQRYRHYDLLLIDDIQFFEHKERI